MNISKTIAKLINSGEIVSREVTFRSTIKPAAAHKATRLEKLVIGEYVIGQEYAKDGSDSGSGDPRSLPWGEWVDYPFTIQHRGADYLRLTPIEDDRPEVRFIVDGDPVTREQFAEYLTPANAKKLTEGNNKPECITVKVDNLVSIQ